MRFLAALFLLLFLSTCTVDDYPSSSEPITHEIWDHLCQKHVRDDGKVNYRGFIQDSLVLNKYLSLLKNHHPNPKRWNRAERLAYWINAYNAFTVKLIVDHYPTPGIKEIKNGIPFVNSVWDIKFIHIEGATYDLNNIEHGILRKKFNEPRIHFAINCASISCPDLRPEAYQALQIEKQLNEQAHLFLADTSKNQIQSDQIAISKIFSWFGGDFKKDGSLIDYLNRYAPAQIQSNADKRFLDYDWRLNDVQ
ncbi:MAG: DUF547 domain-containing protein [Bacteroidota bacterium]